MQRILCRTVSRKEFRRSETDSLSASCITQPLTGCSLEFVRISWWRFVRTSWMKRMVPCCCTGSRSCTIGGFGFPDIAALGLQPNCSNTGTRSSEVQRLFYSLAAGGLTLLRTDTAEFKTDGSHGQDERYTQSTRGMTAMDRSVLFAESESTVRRSAPMRVGEHESRPLLELWRRCPWAQDECPKGDAVALRGDHVARAWPNETDQCPVALALREATGDPWVVFRAVGGDFYGSENGDDDPRYTLDGDLNGIVARFDEEGVCPTGTLYVDRTVKHIDFLPNPGNASTDMTVERLRQEVD